LWGWAPTETHTPEYGPDGRVVRVVVEREPEFDDEQYQLVAALADYEATLNEYGFPVDEATSIDADPENRKGSHFYEAESVIDWASHAVETHLKSKGTEDAYRASRRIRVRRIDR
jgi:hypothetical protein